MIIVTLDIIRIRTGPVPVRGGAECCGLSGASARPLFIDKSGTGPSPDGWSKQEKFAVHHVESSLPHGADLGVMGDENER
jgi:hypothetical protein